MMKKILRIFLLCLFFCEAVSCKNEENAHILYTKALELYVKEDFSNSLDYVNLSLKKSRNFYQADLLKVKNLYFLNKNREAYKIVNSLVNRYPEYTEARIWKVRLSIALEQFDTAEKILDKEISFNSTDWRFYYQYALLSEKLNQVDKKIIMLDKAARYIAESYNVYVDLADVWLNLGMKSDAVECIDKAIILNDKNKDLVKLREYIQQERNF